MEKAFDFGALLRHNEKKHKSRPTQFVSVAEGVAKRLQTNIKNRKSNRLSIFDSVRDLPVSVEPPKPDQKTKVEHRRQQLEKWKEEKEKKKREAAAKKRKPFVAGVPHASLRFVPPPPVRPGTSSRVTRSQTTRNIPEIESISKQRSTKSFAPKNAQFRAPELKHIATIPKLAPPSKSKKKEFMTFEPVIPSNSVMRQTRSKTTYNRPNVTEVKSNQSTAQSKTKSVPARNARSAGLNRATLTKKPNQTSSSSSEKETTTKTNKRVKTPHCDTEAEVAKDLSPKKLVLSSSTETTTSSMESPEPRSRRKSFRKSTISDKESIESISTDLSVVEVRMSATMSPRRSIRNSSVQIADIIVPAEKNTPSKMTPKTPKNTVPRSESNSEEKLRSPKTPGASPLTSDQKELANKISPCVTLSRGKDNARKEMKWKINEGLLDDDAIEMDSVAHFRRQLAAESERLSRRAGEWELVSKQTALPDSVMEAVLSAVGQSRLLVSQKFQQFAGLVDRCAAPEPGSPLVTPADLQGFWDMVFMQVENIDLRFKKLEETRDRGWVDEKPAAKKASKAVRARAPAKKAAAPAVGSRIKDMIAAARKAQKDQEAATTSLTPAKALVTANSNEKTFEAGFFTVTTPVRSPSQATPRNNNTLLKAVLSSEAKKSASKNSASFAMLRASILSKNAEYDGIAPLQQTPQVTPINLYATPGRSILKSANVQSTGTGKKSIKLVLFSDGDNDTSASSTSTEEMTTARNASIVALEPADDATHSDSGVSSLERHVETTTDEVARGQLSRQNAMDLALSPLRTRSKRRSVQTQFVEVENADRRSSRRLSRKKVGDGDAKTPRGRRKNEEEESDSTVEKKTPRRSTKKKALTEIEVNVLEEAVPTPKRSLRTRKSAAQNLAT